MTDKYPNANRLNHDATDTERAVHELALAIIANMPLPIYAKTVPGLVRTTPSGGVVARSLARLADDDRGKEVGFLVRFDPPDDFSPSGIIRLHAQCIGRVIQQDWMVSHDADLLAVDWSQPPPAVISTCHTVLRVIDDLPKFVRCLQGEVAKGPPPPLTDPSDAPPPASPAS